MRKESKTENREPQQASWKSFIVLLKSTKLPWIAIVVVLAVNLAYSQLQLLFPQATQRIMAGDISRNAILMLVAVTLFQSVVVALRQFVQALAVSRVTLSFRKSILKKVLRLPVPYFDRNMANQLISRTTNDTTMLSDFFGAGLPFIPAAVYQLIATLAILFGYNWRLVALEALIVPVILLVTILNGRIQFKWNRRIQGRLALLTGYLAEALANIPLIKVFVKEETEDEKGRKVIDELYATRKRYVFAGGLMSFLVSAEGMVQTLLAVLGGVWLIRAGHISLDVWIAFYLYSSGLVGSATQLLDYWQRIKAAQGAASRISEIAVEAEEEQGGRQKAPDRACDLSFQNVTFRYDQDTILENASFTIPKEKVTAIVGHSGAGKSTVLGLLERFYLPESGCILADGRDIRQIGLSDWRKSIGYVPQNGVLFSGTIRSNMAYGLAYEVSESELIRAATEAGIYDFIASSEKGFDTEVGEGGCRLSGGQRQRIVIARAFLKNPAILLLDEATSNLDAEAKSLVDQALERLKVGRTTVIVTHELSDAEDADQIIVLGRGRQPESGTHSRLMESSDIYRNLKAAERSMSAGRASVLEGREASV